MIVPVSTILIISLVSVFGRQIHARISEVIKQKEELEVLYREVEARQKDIELRNEQLLANHREMREKEKRLTHLAAYDLLTELPNRRMFISRLNFVMSLAEIKEMTFAVVFIDLDNFKRINESVGHVAGDRMLQLVSQRISSQKHPDDFLGRLSGDVFALIITRPLKAAEALEYVEALRIGLCDPFNIEGMEYILNASFGIAIYPQDSTDAEVLLSCAETAMNKAKEYGKNCTQFFRREMKGDILTRVMYEKSLLSSIQNNELFLMYQPQFCTETKDIRGFEALARWQSPQFGLVPPCKFISLAEEVGFILPMGEWILRTACEKLRQLQESIKKDIIISVNISTVQIMSPTFIQRVKDIVSETQIDTRGLEFEITESVMISSVDYVINVLNQLSDLGIRIALDDFGTGYSSLRYLQMLPIETLKIDKSFVEYIDHHDNRQLLVEYTIALVHAMGISVIAEGIDNVEQLAFLKKNHCDYIQGFLWGEPMSEAEIQLLFQKEQGVFLNPDSRA
jgi:diguanylate cyclase (GGDEF)-like protein